jgi:hypothetical protein
LLSFGKLADADCNTVAVTFGTLHAKGIDSGITFEGGPLFFRLIFNVLPRLELSLAQWVRPLLWENLVPS